MFCLIHRNKVKQNETGILQNKTKLKKNEKEVKAIYLIEFKVMVPKMFT